jgi:DNA polymerase elongation subunit (family B)
MRVVYAHTDSIYIPIDSIDKSEEICKQLNNYAQSLFPNIMGLENHPVNLEFEKYYKTLGVGCVKNRNAGFISWKDGKFLEEPEFIVTGFSMKRIAENKIGRKFQETLLKMWTSESSKEDIVEYCIKMYNDVMKGRIPIEKIVKRGRIRKDLDEYKTYSSGIAGVCYYNQHIDQNNPITDSFIYLKCSFIDGPQYVIFPNGSERKATYVSVKELKELDEKYIPDWNYYTNLSIVKKAKPIFDAMNWDINLITLDENQRSLREWL